MGDLEIMYERNHSQREAKVDCLKGDCREKKWLYDPCARSASSHPYYYTMWYQVSEVQLSPCACITHRRRSMRLPSARMINEHPTIYFVWRNACCIHTSWANCPHVGFRRQ